MNPNPYESPKVLQPSQPLIGHDGRHCPSCLGDIGIWAIVKAPLPIFVRCPHCSARLAYRSAWGLLITACVVVFAIGIGMLYVLDAIGVSNSVTKFVAVMTVLLVLWTLFEFVGAQYLRRYWILTKVS